MNQQDCLGSLKTLLSEAILVGTKLAQHDYRNGLQDKQGHFLKQEFDRLYQSTEAFLQVSGLDELSGQKIFPVYEEIQQLANDK